MQKGVLRTHKGRVFRIGSAKLACRLELEATTLIAHGLFERRQLLREEELARALVIYRRGCYTGTCSSKTLASCESGNEVKSCRHLDAKSGETEPHAKTVRQETQGSQEAQESQVCS